MTWAELLASNNVTVLPTTKAELDSLRSIVARSLSDVAATGLSTDARFTMAYDAARTLSLMIVRARACGYRPRSIGGHYNTFLALEAADPAFRDRCRGVDQNKPRSARLRRASCPPRDSAARHPSASDKNLGRSPSCFAAATASMSPTNVQAPTDCAQIVTGSGWNAGWQAPQVTDLIESI